MALLCFVTLLLYTVGLCIAAAANVSSEHTAASLNEKIQSGKTLFVYFGHRITPTISLFLDQLEESAEVLQDYGISVAKVNCSREIVAKFCKGDKLMKKAYLFRGVEILKSFDLDTVFDVNAIVSHVLFTVLYDEVRYVQTAAELQALENTAKGQTDIVLGHVQVFGLSDHRALMETAFVYGAKYQFVLTSGETVPEHLKVECPASVSAGLWFLHCGSVSQLSAPCPVTALTKPLSTLTIYSFLQLMEAPLLTEVSEEPSSVQLSLSLLQVPLLFLFSQPHTDTLDLSTAQTLAWRLRGCCRVLLVHRESPVVKTSQEYNAAHRLPGEDSEIKYLTFNNLEEVIDLFSDGDEEEKEHENEEEDEENWFTLDVIDDEVAGSLHKARDQFVDMDSVTQLTALCFNDTVNKHSLVVVLFYLKWDAVSMTFLHSFVEVAEKLEDAEVEMATVDCGEWTDICAAQPITSFPTVLLLRPRKPAQLYSGMFGAESLLRFILLSAMEYPVWLTEGEEVSSFIHGVLYLQLYNMAGANPSTTPPLPPRVLGLFSHATHPGLSVFTEATLSLRGDVMVGLLTDTVARQWASRFAVELPVVLVSQGATADMQVVSIPLSNANQLTTRIHTALMDPFPELTVDNLPSYLDLNKPLLLLCVGQEEDDQGTRENQRVLEEMRGLQNKGLLHRYLACWIHLGRTPAGVSVLEAYLGYLPPIPALLLSHLPSSGEIFHYPPHTLIMAQSVVQWIQNVEEGDEPPAGVIDNKLWAPAVSFYDFLAIMDQDVAGYAAQRRPNTKPRGSHYREEEEEEEEEGGGVCGDDREAQVPPGPPWLIANHCNPPSPLHTEL